MDMHTRDRLRVLWWLAVPLFPAAAVLVWLWDDTPFGTSVGTTWRDFRTLTGKHHRPDEPWREPEPTDPKPRRPAS